jgi:hypothetical protein
MFAMSRSAQLNQHCAELSDPRRREGTYPLLTLVFITLCAVVAGADDFVAIARFAEKRTKTI